MQRLLEYTGPFTTGQRITLSPLINTEYVHIGMQIPQRQPVAIRERRQNPQSVTPTTIVPDSWREIQTPSPELSVNGKNFCVSPTGILEFDEMADIEMTISILKNLPAETIIDIILYERDVT